MSPEIADGVVYSTEVDIWSFGCFAYELLTGDPPHHRHWNANHNRTELLNAIINEDVPPLEQNWSANMRDFVAKCLFRDPSQRWNINQLLGHDLFLNIQSCREGWVQEFA